MLSHVYTHQFIFACTHILSQYTFTHTHTCLYMHALSLTQAHTNMCSNTHSPTFTAAHTNTFSHVHTHPYSYLLISTHISLVYTPTLTPAHIHMLFFIIHTITHAYLHHHTHMYTHSHVHILTWTHNHTYTWTHQSHPLTHTHTHHIFTHTHNHTEPQSYGPLEDSHGKLMKRSHFKNYYLKTYNAPGLYQVMRSSREERVNRWKMQC